MKKTIILSAGHHPEKRGASWKDLKEWDQNVKFVQHIADRLVELGAPVVTIETGTLPQKVERVNRVARAWGSCIAVELHFNSAGSTYVEGNETLFYPGSVAGKALAEAYNTKFMELAGDLVKRDRGVKEGWYRMDRPGVVDFYGDEDGDEMPDYWLRKTKCPALILEPCFMCQLETIGDDWTKVADAIAEALNQLTC